jgi:hypothetical protein
MAKVTFLAAQVPAAPTYNWSQSDPLMGILDIGFVSTDPPGPGPASTGLQNVATSVEPRPVFSPFLGQVIRAVEPTLGAGEFIYLAVPTSTAIPLGTVVSYTLSGTNQYQVVALPAKGTSQKTGVPIAVCVASTVYNSGAGITSNTTLVQYAWFQCGGVCQVLKPASTQVAPGTVGVYASGTAGRVYFTASTGGQILGSRQANTATVTTTASCVLIYLNGRPVLEGF